MLTPAEADALIGQHLACLPIESLPIAQCAGAVLRENVYAERDAPPFDRVAMDGIALLASSTRRGERRLRVQSSQAAGEPPHSLHDSSGCIEVMTGAVLPHGCDAVVPVEQIQMHEGSAELESGLRVEPWQYVHRRGSDMRQGSLMLPTGAHLSAPEIAIAASAGMARIRVSGQPTIAVISTGTELVEPGEPIEPHQIRRSNAYGVVAALREHGFQRVADDHVVDDERALRERFRFHLDTHDVLILSGGVSMGKLDFVPKVLGELGVRCVFHRIAQRPGKPMWFGMTAEGRAVFALPGNPVSTLVCLARYVIPALYAAMGRNRAVSERMALADRVEIKAALTAFIPVRVASDDWGRLWATPRETNGSGDFTSLAGTHGFVELPPGPAVYEKGFVARIYRW